MSEAPELCSCGNDTLPCSWCAEVSPGQLGHPDDGFKYDDCGCQLCRTGIGDGYGHDDGPKAEPTFLERLKSAREAATPTLYEDDAANERFIMLLVNNAEKVERLIEASNDLHERGDCICAGMAVYRTSDLCLAVAALNEGERP